MWSLGHTNGRVARCVVWSPPGEGTPGALARVLEKRGLGLVPTESPSGALAELCLAEKAGDRVALIVVGDLDSGRMRQAVERFAPSAAVWVFKPGANPPLRAVVVEKKTEPKPTPTEIRDALRAQRREAGPGRPTAGEVAMKPVLRIGRDTPEERSEPDLKLAPGADVPGPSSGAASGAGLSAGSGGKKFSARDVLEDAELEMLLAGERGTGDHER